MQKEHRSNRFSRISWRLIPDITIKDSVYVDADIPLKVETASAANQEPDLVFVQRVGSPITWTDGGIALPVNDLIKEWGLDGKFKEVGPEQITPRRMEKFRPFPWRDIPGRSGTTRKSFKDAGVEIPTTTDQLIEAAKKIRAAGDGPVIASGADGMGQYLFTLIVQSTMTDEEAAKAMGEGDWTIPSCGQRRRALHQAARRESVRGWRRRHRFCFRQHDTTSRGKPR